MPKDGIYIGVDPRDLPDFAVFRDVDEPWCPEMVVLPAGEFLMGSPPDEPERPLGVAAASGDDRLPVRDRAICGDVANTGASWRRRIVTIRRHLRSAGDEDARELARWV